MLHIVAALVTAIAPPHLADSIIGDLHERRDRGDAFRSLLSLLAYATQRTFAENWTVALVAAVVTCALCDAAIPLWGPIGLDGAVFHVLRLVVIGFALGCIRRASTLSCAFLLLLIAISNLIIDTHDAQAVGSVLSHSTYYATLLTDGAAMASSLVALRIIRLVRVLAR